MGGMAVVDGSERHRHRHRSTADLTILHSFLHSHIRPNLSTYPLRFVSLVFGIRSVSEFAARLTMTDVTQWLLHDVHSDARTCACSRWVKI